MSCRRIEWLDVQRPSELVALRDWLKIPGGVTIHFIVEPEVDTVAVVQRMPKVSGRQCIQIVRQQLTQETRTNKTRLSENAGVAVRTF